MNNDRIPAFLIAILALIAGFVGGCTTTDYWHSEIIKHGYAQHNPITGNWEWKESK